MADVTQLLNKLKAKADNAQFSASTRMLTDLQSSVNRKTGVLARSRRVSYSKGGSSFSTTISYNPPDDRDLWTDRGTKPHRIYFDPPQSLKFRVGWRKVAVIKHPGNKPYRWWSKTVTQSNWSRMLRDAFH